MAEKPIDEQMFLATVISGNSLVGTRVTCGDVTTYTPSILLGDVGIIEKSRQRYVQMVAGYRTGQHRHSFRIRAVLSLCTGWRGPSKVRLTCIFDAFECIGKLP